MEAKERPADTGPSGVTSVSEPTASDTTTAPEHAQDEMEARERHVDTGPSGATGVSEPSASDSTIAPEHAQVEMEARWRQASTGPSGTTGISEPYASDTTTTTPEHAQAEMGARERQAGVDTSGMTGVSGPSAADTATAHEHAQAKMETRERQIGAGPSGMIGVSEPSASNTITAHEHAQAEMEARERHVDAGLSGATGVSEPFASDTTTAPEHAQVEMEATTRQASAGPCGTIGVSEPFALDTTTALEHAQDEMEARERQVGADTSGTTSVSGPFASDTTIGHERAQDEMEARERQVGADTSGTKGVSGPSASDTTTGHERAQAEMEAREKQAGAGPCGMIGVSEPSASITITAHELAQDPLPVEVAVAAMPERLEEDNITSYRSCILHCIVALLIPVLNAGNTIISKKAITEGMRMRFAVYSCYRNAIAMTVLLPLVLCNRNSIPTMTYAVFFKLLALTIVDSVIGQNLLSASETPATFSAIMLGVSPALTFLASWIFRLESVMIKERRSQAKLLGTAVVTAGAISVGLKSGKTITLFSTSDGGRHETVKHQLREDWVRGPLFVVLALLCSVSYNIILGKIVKGYPSPLAITAFVSTVGAILNLGVALVLERGRGISWFVDFNIQMLAYFYGGLMVSGLAMYIQTTLMRRRGPVFVTAFNPLFLVLVMTAGSITLKENLHLWSVIGTALIIVGLIVLIWGKSGQAVPSR